MRLNFKTSRFFKISQSTEKHLNFRCENSRYLSSFSMFIICMMTINVIIVLSL